MSTPLVPDTYTSGFRCEVDSRRRSQPTWRSLIKASRFTVVLVEEPNDIPEGKQHEAHAEANRYRGDQRANDQLLGRHARELLNLLLVEQLINPDKWHVDRLSQRRGVRIRFAAEVRDRIRSTSYCDLLPGSFAEESGCLLGGDVTGDLDRRLGECHIVTGINEPGRCVVVRIDHAQAHGT